MKLVKLGSRDNYLKKEPFNFKPIEGLDKFYVLTSFVEGQSPEYQNEMDKLFMVTEGNIQFDVDQHKTNLNAGDLILIQNGEKFKFDAGSGAKLMEFNREPPAENGNKFMEYAIKRHSTRAFSDKPVLKKDIYYILKIGMHAPSGANRQPWKFIVVGDPEMKRKIREEAERVEEKFYKKIKHTQLYDEFSSMGLSWKKPFLESAPFLICVFANPKQPYYKESIWLATGWMLLAAENLGLATVTYTPAEMNFLNNLLKVEKPYQPELIIPVGYPESTEPLQPRKDIYEVVSWV
jgi:nitroreductase/quercetin dioxygenase-like cupin family protein